MDGVSLEDKIAGRATKSVPVAPSYRGARGHGTLRRSGSPHHPCHAISLTEGEGLALILQPSRNSRNSEGDLWCDVAGCACQTQDPLWMGMIFLTYASAILALAVSHAAEGGERIPLASAVPLTDRCTGYRPALSDCIMLYQDVRAIRFLQEDLGIVFSSRAG